MNVGLVTGPRTPSARQAPRTNVVLPLPSSPLTSTTSPGRSRAASSAPAASVSAALRLTIRTPSVWRARDRGAGQPNRPIWSAAGSASSGDHRRSRPRAGGGSSASSAGSRAKSSRSCSFTARRAQRRRRVEERVELDRPAAELVLLRLAVDPGDPAAGAAQQLGGEVAERADHPRLDQLDLALQVGAAGLDLVGLGVAVAGRAATSGRCVTKTSSRASPISASSSSSSLPGAAHERQALLVLVGSRAPRPRTSGRRRRCRSRTPPGCGVSCSGQRVQARASLVERDQLLAALGGGAGHPDGKPKPASAALAPSAGQPNTPNERYP